jgi:hypothetical protein
VTLLLGVLTPPNDLAVRQDPILCCVVGQDRVSSPPAVDQIIFDASTLAGFDVICTAPTIETVRVSLAGDGVRPAPAIESVVFGGTYQRVLGPALPTFTTARAVPAHAITISPTTANKMAVLLVIRLPP